MPLSVCSASIRVVAAALLLVSLGGVGVGCSSGRADRQRPADFAMTFRFESGTLPPPSHVEWVVEIAKGRGRLSYAPDYPSRKPPTFTGTFKVSDAQLDGLYRRLDEERLLRNVKESERPSGAASVEATITDGGSHYVLGPQPGEDGASLEAIRPDVRAVVPDRVWSDVQRQRTVYASARYPGQSP